MTTNKGILRRSVSLASGLLLAWGLCFSVCTAALRREPFTTIASVFSVVPASLDIGRPGKWNVVALQQASEALVADAQGEPATLQLKVHYLEAFTEKGWSFRMMASDGSVAVRGVKIPYRIWAYFRGDQAEALSKVHKGSTVTLAGTLGRADIQMNDGNPTLNLDVFARKVEAH